MFLYVFIFYCLKLWAHCRFWNGRPHSEVPSHCQTWGSAGWFRTLVLGPLVVCYTKQNQTCWRWRCQNVPNYLKYTSKVSFIRRRQCCCMLLSFFKSDHASSLSRSRIGMRFHESWFVMFYRFFLFRRLHIMDSDGAWWCSAERFSCLLGETQLHADRGTRTFDSERSWWQPCWPTTSIMNITSINSTTLTLAHC